MKTWPIWMISAATVWLAAQTVCEAGAYQDGPKIGESVVRTAGELAARKLSANRSVLNADGMDVCYVTIERVDQSGTVCPRAMNGLHFEVEGVAELKGVAHGDQMGHDVFPDATHPLFYGRPWRFCITFLENPGKRY